jgi:hypothetical protein
MLTLADIDAHPALAGDHPVALGGKLYPSLTAEPENLLDSVD